PPPQISTLLPYTTLFRSKVPFTPVQLKARFTFVLSTLPDGVTVQVGKLGMTTFKLIASVPVFLRQKPFAPESAPPGTIPVNANPDRKSTRLNSSHVAISY